ncbi:FtsK/SpoIIIE domain-containing protein [Streptomyces sp. NPDC060194]|uniref:FtsK/SpoIIIE domain-containing protein n=1 Tax=Streptomyces sp. NPDC060194 TaxID=3347069 RepID=UPI00364F9198
MQIRLTVLGPRSGQSPARACDVVVTAPAGTALAAVASGLASAVAGPDSTAGGGAPALYAGRDRLDPHRRTLGEPPLVDGAVLSLGAPGDEPIVPDGSAAAQLHVVAGPDAGGVHLLHGGQIHVGRSADADVPIDDPDVSRTHCAVTVAPDGRVTVADLRSTNGTAIGGERLADRPARLLPGALLRVGESTLQLTGPEPRTLPVTPDGEGRLRIAAPGRAPRPSPVPAPREATAPAPYGQVPAQGGDAPSAAGGTARLTADRQPAERRAQERAAVRQAYDRPPYDRTADAPDARPRLLPSARTPDAVPQARTRPLPGAPAAPAEGDARTAHRPAPAEPVEPAEWPDAPTGPRDDVPAEHGRIGTPLRGTSLPARERRRGGIGAWARRLAGGREPDAYGDGVRDEAEAAFDPEGPQQRPGDPHGRARSAAAGAARAAAPAPRPLAPDTWPDPAALLLTALGPGPRLWERAADHPEALTVRVGTADRPGLPSVPVTVDLRETGSLGLAGPRARLAGLARCVVAQLTALHAPADLEVVLISTDRSREAAARAAEWAWLGWLPHLRPAHGQDCRLLLAHDREQAAARTGELLQRLERTPHGPPADGGAGPYTVVLVDGDPGAADVREAVVRLAQEGPAVGIHVVCLAETAAASPASPVAETYEAACAASPAFRACGAAALLSGDVATALRLLRTSAGQPVGHGTLAVVDAVSAAWADRFARALAPLRSDGAPTGGRRERTATALPPASRLLDELGLARATPASLLARWASAGDDERSVGGRAHAVLGAGPRGPLVVDLAAEGPHLLVEGPPGSGRSELLRALAASLGAAERPDRLALVLVEGADGPERGEGLRACTELPHTTTLLTANDAVRMREFAQALSTELKRRAELLGTVDFTQWHTDRDRVRRLVAQRAPGRSGPAGGPDPSGDGDVEAPPSGTLRLRTTTPPPPGPPLPRLVVLVDDFDALVAPALGSPGRPSAGSVVRALEAVARDGHRLGVHLVAVTGRPDVTAATEASGRAALRAVLEPPAPAGAGPEAPAPGRGVLHAHGPATPFQAGRVTGRIPRTATLRPTVVPLEWERMGDPPARRPVRELGNGPTDLALLASALERAARTAEAEPVAPLL